MTLRPSLLWDVCGLAGAGLVVGGVACWSGPAACVLAGCGLVWLAYRGAKADATDATTRRPGGAGRDAREPPVLAE
jgi:hypothetical protein